VNYSRKSIYISRASSNFTLQTEFSCDADSPFCSLVSDTSDCTSLALSSRSLERFRVSLLTEKISSQFGWIIFEKIEREFQMKYSRLLRNLRADYSTSYITDVQVFNAVEIRSDKRRKADVAWNLLRDDHDFIQSRDVGSLFLKYFCCLCETARDEHKISSQISIMIRVVYDQSAQNAYRIYDKVLKKHISSVEVLLCAYERLQRACVLVALLKIVLSKEQIENARSIVNRLLEDQSEIDSFRLVEIDDISNLLTIFVRSFPHMKRVRLVKNDVHNALEFVQLVIDFSELKTCRLFNVIIARLEELQMSLCLRIFLYVRKTLAYASKEQHLSLIKKLFESLNDFYSTSDLASNEIASNFMSYCSIILFLHSREFSRDSFLLNMHHCMKEDDVSKKQWTRAWRELELKQKYQRQSDLIVACENVQHDLIHLASCRDRYWIKLSIFSIADRSILWKNILRLSAPQSSGLLTSLWSLKS